MQLSALGAQMSTDFIDESLTSLTLETLLVEAFDDDDFYRAVKKASALSAAVSQYPELEALNNSLDDLKRRSLSAKQKVGVQNWLDLPWGKKKSLSRYAGGIDSLKSTLIKGIRSLRNMIDMFPDIEKDVPLEQALSESEEGSQIEKSFRSEVADIFGGGAFQQIGVLLGLVDQFKAVITGESLAEDLLKLSYNQIVSLGNDIAKGTSSRTDSPPVQTDDENSQDSEADPQTVDDTSHASQSETADDLAGQIFDHLKTSMSQTPSDPNNPDNADATLKKVLADFLRTKGIAESTVRSLENPALLTLFEISGGSKGKLKTYLKSRNIMLTESGRVQTGTDDIALDRWRMMAGIKEKR